MTTTPDEILRLVGKQPEPEPPATFRGVIQQALDDLADEVERGNADRCLSALKELRAWATIPKGVGASLHAEMWPSLSPSARKRLAEIVGRGLGERR